MHQPTLSTPTWNCLHCECVLILWCVNSFPVPTSPVLTVNRHPPSSSSLAVILEFHLAHKTQQVLICKTRQVRLHSYINIFHVWISSLHLFKLYLKYTLSNVHVLWWFVLRTRLFRVHIFVINEFSALLNRPLVRTWKSVPTLFVWTSEIFWLSEPGLMNHHCTQIIITDYWSTSTI